MREKIKVSVIYGHSELKQFIKFESGRMVYYSYRIDYDRNGNETGRTEPIAISSLGWNNGEPFTESDYENIRNS
jgi:predicted ATP-dependent endonuclease of OLD family